jgi:phage protein D
MAETMEQVVGLWVDVWLDNEKVSAQVAPYVTSLEYSDNLDGDEPDRITVKLADPAGLFQGQYYPKKGASLRFEFGFDKPEREIVFKSAVGFEVKKVTITGPPDVVTWEASGQKPAGKIHIRKSRAWEKKTFKQLAEAITSEHGIGLVYNSKLDVNFLYLAQQHESDMELLKRVCVKYGVTMSLKSGKDGLTVVIVDPGKPINPISNIKYEIKRESVTSFSFSDEAVQGTGGAHTQYFDPNKKEAIRVDINGDGGEHVIRTVGVQQSAAAHIQGKKNDEKKNEIKNSLTLPGNPQLLSGVLANLMGWSHNDGEWLICESKHTLDVPGGYKTEITLRRPQ